MSASATQGGHNYLLMLIGLVLVHTDCWNCLATSL